MSTPLCLWGVPMVGKPRPQPVFTPTGASRFRPGPYPDHNPDTENHSCRVLLAETYPPVPMVIPAASLVLLGTSEGQVGGKQSPRPTAASSHWTHGRNRSRGRAWEPWERLRGRKCHGWGGDALCGLGPGGGCLRGPWPWALRDAQHPPSKDKRRRCLAKRAKDTPAM